MSYHWQDPTDPESLELCRCNVCQVHWFKHPHTNEDIQGAYIMPADRREHWRRQREEAHARSIAQSLESDDGDYSDIEGSSTLEAERRGDDSPPTSPSPPPPCEPRTSQNIILERLAAISATLSLNPTLPSVDPASIIFVVPPSVCTRQSGWNLNCRKDLRLLEGYCGNDGLLTEERWVTSSLSAICNESWDSHPKYEVACSDVIAQLRIRENTILDLKEDIWNEQRKEWEKWGESYVVDTIQHMSNPFLHWHPATLVSYLLASSAHIFFNVSLSGSDTILLLTKYLVHTMEQPRPDPNVPLGALEASVPKTTATVISRLNIEPKTRSYVTCTSCFKTYPPIRHGHFPQICEHQPTPSSPPCNSNLRRERQLVDGTTASVPVRLYVHHELEEWIARLYTQPEMEALLDRDLRSTLSEELWDICDAPGIQQFLGPDGRPFICEPGREGRLLFALNMDGLNPHKNMEAGKKVSVGAIYMVCLNIPADSRYEHSNMFLVGVIPGPTEPSREQINYILEYVVDDLNVIWQPGFYLSATYKYPHGRPVIGALIPLICDLLAARQMSGCAGHASNNNFCSFCQLKAQDMNTFDYWAWPTRSREEHENLARAWKDASTQDQRDALYGETGIRWTELLRLPYWDPTRFVVIDVMHALFLGLLKHHVRNVWGMDATLDDSDPFVLPGTVEFCPRKLQKARDALETEDYAGLAKARRVELQELCREQKPMLPYGGRKRTILATLITHVKKRKVNLDVLSEDGTEGKDASEDDNEFSDDEDLEDYPSGKKAHSQRTKNGVIIGKQTLMEIRQDMGSITLPSWVSAAPKRPGESKTGKLSADQWKAFGTINLVVTLGRLWNPAKQKEDTPQAARRRAMFTNFMHLISAVKIGSMRVMSEDRIKNYTAHMHSYLTTLQELYPWTGITPYQHMSLHLPDLLRRFGPTPGWRCYAFERYNHILQNSLTNKRFGDMEQTMFRKFCLKQNLRMVIRSLNVPEDARGMIAALQEKLSISETPGSGTLTQDLFSTSSHKPSEFKQDTAKALPLSWVSLLKDHIRRKDSAVDLKLISTHGHVVKKIKERGETFSVASHGNIKHSTIYYRESSGNAWAGRIAGIFNHQRLSGKDLKNELFFIIERFKAFTAPQGISDPYKAYDSAGKLFMEETYKGLAIVPFADVLYHFASYRYHIDEDVVMLALPLDKW